MSACDDPDCKCECHDGGDDNSYDGLAGSEEIGAIYETIDAYFAPATPLQPSREHATILQNGLEKLEDAICDQCGDPGKLYPLHERVRRVIGALQARTRI